MKFEGDIVHRKSNYYVIYLGLEKNETAPKPVLPEPREPSKKEKEEAVQFLIPRTKDVSTNTIRYFFVTVPMVSFKTCPNFITFL